MKMSFKYFKNYSKLTAFLQFSGLQRIPTTNFYNLFQLHNMVAH